jgi:hypothetical protein
MEVDAYTETEKWAIARGLPEGSRGFDSPSLRTTDENGLEKPNAKTIESKVTAMYGGLADDASTEVIGHIIPNKTKVRLSDGSEKTRDAEKGDRYLEKPPTFIKEQLLDPKGWKCPDEKKK